METRTLGQLLSSARKGGDISQLACAVLLRSLRDGWDMSKAIDVDRNNIVLSGRIRVSILFGLYYNSDIGLDYVVRVNVV